MTGDEFIHFPYIVFEIIVLIARNKGGDKYIELKLGYGRNLNRVTGSLVMFGWTEWMNSNCSVASFIFPAIR